MTKEQEAAVLELITKHLNKAWENGAREERQNVVAWLRGRQEAAEWALTAAGYEHAADAIERGEHHREEER